MANVNQDRSPLGQAESLRTPVVLLQGMEDPVVPPAQAEFLVRVLRRKGLPFAYLTFEGERHGFRQSASIRRALEVELYFDSRIFGFKLADRVEPVPIENPKWTRAVSVCFSLVFWGGAALAQPSAEDQLWGFCDTNRRNDIKLYAQVIVLSHCPIYSSASRP